MKRRAGERFPIHGPGLQRVRLAWFGSSRLMIRHSFRRT